MSEQLTFVCVPEQPFSRLELRRWVAERRAAGLAPEGRVTVMVKHPLREGDGGCRWCGAGPDEAIEVA